MSDEMTAEERTAADAAAERTRRYIEARSGKPKTEAAQRAIDAGLVAVDDHDATDLLRLARLIAAGILRSRQGPDGMVIERVPEPRAAKAKRLERKRKRQLKRRARK